LYAAAASLRATTFRLQSVSVAPKGRFGQSKQRHQENPSCRVEDTKWGEIVALYNALARLRPSPVVALNRALAVAEIEGPERGLEEVCAITGPERLASYPFCEAALGELELRCGRGDVAKRHFRTALALARNTAERRFLARRIAECEPA
jgi:predicted RNA polymerase sigma factor